VGYCEIIVNVIAHFNFVGFGRHPVNDRMTWPGGADWPASRMQAAPITSLLNTRVTQL